MTTEQINQALNEFELFNQFIPLKQEVLHQSLVGKEIHIKENIYYLDNIEEIKRYYVNEICTLSQYNGSVLRNSKILRSRIESLLNTLYLGNVSVYLIDMLTEYIYNGFEEVYNDLEENNN